MKRANPKPAEYIKGFQKLRSKNKTGKGDLCAPWQTYP